MTRILAAFLVASTTFALPLRAGDELGLKDFIARDYEENLDALFKHFHANPELSFLEHATAARLAKELRALGVEVTEGIGGTGIVGMLHNGDGPLVLVRADMDGLPIKEDSGLPYASKATQVNLAGEEVPVMHACGHDVHITSLVGTARLLTHLKDRWSGTVMFVGQPAEERIGGAKAMFGRRPLRTLRGARFSPSPFHVSAGDPAGKLAILPKA